jgi:hypothetical protein
MRLAAIVAVVLLAVIAAFQVSLAVGAPWGSAAWGGSHVGVLPTRLRIASLVAGLFLYPLLILFVLDSAGVFTTTWVPRIGRAGMWVLTGFFAVGTIANIASRSKKERIWWPVSLAIAVCCAIIAVAI